MNLQSYKWKQSIRKGELVFNFVCVSFNLESLFNKGSWGTKQKKTLLETKRYAYDYQFILRFLYSCPRRVQNTEPLYLKKHHKVQGGGYLDYDLVKKLYTVEYTEFKNDIAIGVFSVVIPKELSKMK